MKNKQINETFQSIASAREAVIHAQENPNPEELQRARQKLLLAQDSMKDIKNEIETATEEEQKQYHHAYEHLNHLQENLDAVIHIHNN